MSHNSTIPSLEDAALEAGLTPAEAEALFLAAEGLGYAEIARRLSITPGAAQRRCSRAHEKLHAHRARLRTVAWHQSPERTPGERVAWRRRLFEATLAGS